MHLQVANALEGSLGRWLELGPATIVVLWAGWPVFARAWESGGSSQPQLCSS